MTNRLEALLLDIRQLEQKVAEELNREKTQLGYTLRKGRIVFEAEIGRRHRQLAKGLLRYFAESSLKVMLTAPIIYSLFLPLMLIDLFAWVFQKTCFPIYGIPPVRRGDYLVLDRQHLRYLNFIERINCLYCGYANGLMAYASEIAARTEQYWCPIKHASPLEAVHSRYHLFFSYGDAEAYRNGLETLRRRFDDIQENKGMP
jgi:hypothetical protein